MPLEVLGFDLRIAPESAGTAWDKSRRATYLLNEDVPFPVAVDRAVWPPSINSTAHKDAAAAGGIAENIGALNGLNLMTADVGGQLSATVSSARSVLLGLTSDQETVARLRHMHSIDACLRTPAELDAAGWAFWGYDVADAWLTSGLTNCGFTPAEKGPFLQRYSRALNNYGLFDDYKLATEYARETNLRVPGHAPFLVFGMWTTPAA